MPPPPVIVPPGKPRYAFHLLLAAWMLLVAGSFAWNWHQARTAIVHLAATQARAAHDKDVLYRQWAASHGGVYVRPTKETPPNPYLDVPDRDVVTTTGMRLTLVNPAYMTRQVQELEPGKYGTRGRITSLNPLRPQNGPDAWERQALESFERGAAEALSVVTVDGARHVRLMQALQTTASCLACHAKQGYRLGQVRGGISVSVPLDPFERLADGQFRSMAIAHVLLGGLGVLGLVAFRARTERHVAELTRSIDALHESEQRFRRIFEQAPVAYQSVSADGRLLHVNEAWLGLFGCTREQAIGRSVYDFVPPEHREECRRTFAEFLLAGTVARAVVPFLRADGSQVLGRVDGRVAHDARGTIAATHWVIYDVTEQRRAEMQLAATSRLLGALVEHLPAGILVEDQQRRVLHVNQHFCDLFQLAVPPSGMLGADCAQAADAVKRLFAEPDGFIAGIEARVASAEIVRDEVLPLADGRVFERDYVPVRLGSGETCHLWRYEDATDRASAKRALEASEERFSKAFHRAPTMMTISRVEDGTYLEVNDAFLRVTGYTREEVIGRTSADVVMIEPAVRQQGMQLLLGQGRLEAAQLMLRAKDGRRISTLFFGELIEMAGEQRLLSMALDITDRLALEEQLRHSQKLEAIGQLAGGVAHDFNNILAVMLMQIGLLQDAPVATGETATALAELQQQAERAANLTRQLLAFSRRQVMQVRPVEVGELLGNLLTMLRRILGEHVMLDVHTPAQHQVIEGDAGMIGQVVLNLCVNARDAMPAGGRLSISAESVNVPVPPPHADHARAGRYVRLEVRDTGSGIDPAVIEHIFEPFFTTKAVGQGTGLGLSTVYGIVMQHRGWVEVESTVGDGSTFRVFLPASAAPEPLAEERPEPAPASSGRGETVLVVEDEESVRRLVTHSLSRLGYRVLEASNAEAARAVWASHRDEIALLFTDVIMPGGTGLDLARGLRQERPRLRVILSSGYSAEIASTSRLPEANVSLLVKPYSIAALGKAVRDALDA